MKKLLASLLAVIAMVTVLAASVYAATPGDSDYEVTTTVDVSSVAGDKVELTNTDSKTVVSIPKTALPEGVTSVTFAAKKLDKSSDAYVAANKLAEKSGFKNAILFDFKLLDQNDVAIEKLNGKISITVACPSDVNTVLYYNDKDGSLVSLGGTVKDGFITFETDHFSYYMLAQKESTKNPQTSDATPLIFVGLVAVAVAGGLFACKKFAKAK